jgi:hypothetical protein
VVWKRAVGLSFDVCYGVDTVVGGRGGRCPSSRWLMCVVVRRKSIKRFGSRTLGIKYYDTYRLKTLGRVG